MSSAIRSIIRRIGAGDGFDNSTTYPDSVLNDWITQAQLSVPTNKLGDKANYAVAYYSAHLMLSASSKVSSTGGSVTMEKSGDVQRSYSAGSGSGSSKYLDEYNRLIKTLVRPSPFVLNGR